jgi:hypothetical protein
MEQSPFWEANSHSASQEIPRLLWNPKFHNYVHNSPPIPRFYVTFHNKLVFCGGKLLDSRLPRHKLEDHPFPAVNDCLFNTFAATLSIWVLSPPSVAWGRAIPWWQGPTKHGMKIAYKILVGSAEGKRPLGRRRHGWEDYSKVSLGEIRCDHVRSLDSF